MSKNAGNNIAPSVSVSQNFLTSGKTIRRLLRLTSICRDDHVIEIGAGKGHITRELVKACRAVSAYEIDRTLYEQVIQKLGDAPNLNVSRMDFLKAALPKSGEYKVFSNIPFSITTGIVRKLTTAKNPPQESWLVMERGAAKRFTGTPRESSASLLIKPYFDAGISYYFSRQDFHPMPSADIVLLHLTKKQAPDIPVSQRESFADFVAESTRYGVNRYLTKRQVDTALRLAGLPRIQESGIMLYVQWLCLFRCYSRLY